MEFPLLLAMKDIREKEKEELLKKKNNPM